MKKNRNIQYFILLLLGAIAMALSGLNWHIGIAAWLAPVFLLLFTRKVKWQGFLLFFIVISIVGGISQTDNNLTNLPEINLFNGISFGIFCTIPYLIDRLLNRNEKKFIYTLIFPASVALIEYVVSFAIGTWGSIAHTQYAFKALIQIASVTGIYGIWFLISWFATIVVWFIDNKEKNNSKRTWIIVFCSVFVIVLIFGWFRMHSTINTLDKTKLAIVLSDTNIDDYTDDLKGLATDKNLIIPPRVFSDSSTIQTLITRTQQAAEQGAKIIVWNELALILSPGQKAQVVSSIQEICKKYKVYISTTILEESIKKNTKPFNNISLLIAPTGKIEWEYKKSFLQPTAEAPIINAGNFNMPVLHTIYGNIGNVICADLDMQHYMKQAGEKSVDLLLVPAYDWEGITPLHSQMAAIQAIQFGCNIIRSNGKGVSALYNWKGEEIVSINNLQSDQKILISEIPIESVKTLYTSMGDIFIIFCGVYILIMITLRILKKY